MFRPPEYAALINPAHNAFANGWTILLANHVEALNRMADGVRGNALSRELNRVLQGLGPKDWSPIGEYKREAPK